MILFNITMDYISSAIDINFRPLTVYYRVAFEKLYLWNRIRKAILHIDTESLFALALNIPDSWKRIGACAKNSCRKENIFLEKRRHSSQKESTKGYQFIDEYRNLFAVCCSVAVATFENLSEHLLQTSKAQTGKRSYPKAEHPASNSNQATSCFVWAFG